MKRLRLLLILMAMAIVAFAGTAMAATATGTLDVTASVASTCNVTSTTDVAFGSYDPTSGTDDTDGSGSFSFRCTKNNAFQLHIARTDNMNNGTDNLAYVLYSDAGRTTAWAIAAAADPAGESPAGSNAVKTRDVYGKIPALQDVSAGAYTETVTVTVTY